MGWEEITAEIARELTLKASTTVPVYFGSIQDYPAEVFYAYEDKAEKIKFIAHYQKGPDESLLRKKIDESFAGNKDYKPKNLILTDGLLAYSFIKGMFDKRAKADFTEMLKNILTALNNAGAGPKKCCNRCSIAVEQPLLLTGELAELCSACLETIRQECENEKRKYDKRQVSLFNVAIAGLLAALLGAALWAGITIVTARMYAMIAIVNGLIVGNAMYYIAKKKSNIVLTGVFLFTILSVLLGNVFCYAFFFQQELAAEGYAFELSVFLQYLPQIMMEGLEDTLFSGFCGLLGAAGAAKISDRYSPPIHVVETLK